MSNPAVYSAVVRAVSGLVRDLRAAGFTEQISIALVGEDAARLDEAIGHGRTALNTNVRERDNHKACDIAGAEVRWSLN